MGAHLIDGEFQSDKYPTTPRGKVPLSVKDKAAQDLLWEYARRHRSIDAEFSDDLEAALKAAGFEPQVPARVQSQEGTRPRFFEIDEDGGNVTHLVVQTSLEACLKEAAPLLYDDNDDDFRAEFALTELTLEQAKERRVGQDDPTDPEVLADAPVGSYYCSEF